MKSLPLYKSIKSTIEESEQLDLVKDCARCDLHKTNTKTCAGDLGNPGGILAIVDNPTKEEVQANGNVLSKYRKFLYSIIKKHHTDDKIAFSWGLRCFIGKAPVQKHIKGCRPYLAKTIASCEAKKILLFGSTASETVLGRKFKSVRKAYTYLEDGTQVFLFQHPKYVILNKFERDRFEADVQWALNETPSWPPTEAIYRIVETAEDAEKACKDLASNQWYAFDTETFGRTHDKDFQIISLAASAKGSDDSWVWNRNSLSRKECVKPLIELFKNPNIGVVGQNLKYDILAVKGHFDVWIKNKIAGDTRLWTKLENAEASGYLEDIAESVGMGGHKKEAQTALKQALKLARDDFALPKKKGFILNPKAYAYGFIKQEVLDRYCARDTVTTVRAGESLEARILSSKSDSFIWNSTIRDATYTYSRVEDWGVAIDLNNLSLFQTHVDTKLVEVEKQLKSWANINYNAPAQLADLLYSRLKLPVFNRTPNGTPSTDMASLKALKGRHRIVDSLLDYRKFQKLKTAYADKIPLHLRDDDRIHATIDLGGARSGRTSCKDPNLQQVTRSKTLEGRLLKNCYVASPGCKLVQLDYKTLEIMIAAYLSGDARMISVLKSGYDFHQKTAEDISNIVWGITPGQITPAHRDIAKTTVFSKLYGSGNWAISKKLGVKIGAIDAAVDAIFSQYSTLNKWINSQIKYAYKNGCTHTYWNGQIARTRYLPNITSVDDAKRATAERSAYNSAVQGTANEYCLASANEVVRMIERENLPAKLVLTVHDSIILDVEENFVVPMATKVRDIMVSHECGEVPLKVDIEYGDTWGELQKLVI